MKDAEKILLVINDFDKTDRDIIMQNINLYVIDRMHDKRMNAYDVIQLITGKSKGFVLSWFNNKEVKLPLISLCRIAEFANVNIHTFFLPNTGRDLDSIDSECDSMYGNDCGLLYIKAFEAQRNASKKTVVDNLERHYPERTRERTERLMRLTGAKHYAVKAWFNRGFRSRLPIRVLCILAIDSDIDYFDWFN